MVAGPEVARVIAQFQAGNEHWGRGVDTRHHDGQTQSVQTMFTKDVCSLVNVIEELGNPFEEESMDLVFHDTKEMADLTAIESLRNVKRIGQEQFQVLMKECLVERTKSIYDAIC